jgi:hypothetical protein
VAWIFSPAAQKDMGTAVPRSFQVEPGNRKRNTRSTILNYHSLYMQASRRWSYKFLLLMEN